MDAENVVDGGIRHRSYQVLSALETMNITRPDAPKGFVTRLAEENGWTIDRAEAADREYRRFLMLAWISDDMVVPSKDVDAAWHEHLLHTRHYWETTCRDILGKPFHHDPGDGSVGDADMHTAGYERTLTLYERTFGEPAPTDVWPRSCRCPVEPAASGGEAVLALPGWTIPAAVAPISYAWLPGVMGGVTAALLLLMALIIAIASGQARSAERRLNERQRRNLGTTSRRTASYGSTAGGSRTSGSRDRSSDTSRSGNDDASMAALWISSPDTSTGTSHHSSHSSHSSHSDGGSSHSSHSSCGSSHSSCGGHSCGGSSCGGSSCGGGGCGGS